MKHAWRDGEQMPFDGKKFIVEPTVAGFGCHDADRRSAGSLAEVPLPEVLKWIVRQIIYGHYKEQCDENGDVVSLSIGQTAPYDMPTENDAAEEAGKACLGVNLAGLVAEAREKGTSEKTHDFEKSIWDGATISTRLRIELHYASVFCELLGRVSKKLRKLELLPILESAPESTRDYLAEATRCYLLKLDRACVALCRACVEDTLKETLTAQMEKDWKEEINRRSPAKGPMEALIDVCAKHGVLGTHKKDAHAIRQAGNKVLHLQPEESSSPKVDVAGDVLKKTRTLIGFIHGSRGSSK